jgi:putative proteasome-type protease
LVLASATGSNASVDQVAIVPKMPVFEVVTELVMVLLIAGNFI